MSVRRAPCSLRDATLIILGLPCVLRALPCSATLCCGLVRYTLRSLSRLAAMAEVWEHGGVQSIATGIERGSISEIPPVQKFVLEPPSPGRQPQNSLSTLHAVGAHSGGWGRVWGRGRARAAAQTLSGPPGALRGPFLARPRPARPPRARLASLRCGGPLQPLGERPEGGGKR